MNKSIRLRHLMIAAMPVIHIVSVAKEEAAGGIAGIATTLTAQLNALATLIGTVGFVAGMLFTIAALFKLKQHKDNPTQVPVGTPLMMIAIGASLMFLGNFIKPLGETLFGAGEGGKGPSAGGAATGLTSGFAEKK